MKIYTIVIGILMIIGAFVSYPYHLYQELDSIRLVGGDAYNLIIASNIISAKYICCNLSLCFGLLFIILSFFVKRKAQK